MNFIVSANTDIGITKSTNQDSLSVKVINTPLGRMTFAILCDGMGGLAKGEVASASVIRAFDQWLYNELEKNNYPAGFTACREYVLSLWEAPVYTEPVESDDALVDFLYDEDTYIRIATSEDGWSILQYFDDTRVYVRSDALQALQ